LTQVRPVVRSREEGDGGARASHAAGNVRNMGEAAARRVLAGRYEIIGVLGRGGMGTVYRGRDLELGRPVAIKLLDAQLSSEAAALARFRREARSAARLTHPNVVTVYDSGVDHGEHYIVMELVAGGSLKELLRERGQLPLPLALALGDDILRALGAAHEDGLVHRDVSPGNVMVTRDGTAKVADFGVARAFGPGAEQTGSIAGTAAYLAPEQAAGEVVTPAADIYGAGCLLYTMLTGQPPFGGGNPVTVAMRHRDEMPAAPSALRAGLPPAVDALVLKALQKRPQDRFASVQDMRRALAGTGVSLPDPGSREAWPHGPQPADRPTSVTRIASPSDRPGTTAVWPGAPAAGAAAAGAAAAGAAAAGAGAAGAAAARARTRQPARAAQPRRRPPPPPPRPMSRPLIMLIALLVIAAAVVILLAASGALSSGSPPSSGGPAAAPATRTPATSAPATTAPATTTPATTTPAPAPQTASPAPGGGGKGNPGKGPKKNKPGKGKKKDQTSQTGTPGPTATPAPAATATSTIAPTAAG
jgi:eukaryotic-like serine/threonine-protein kinase